MDHRNVISWLIVLTVMAGLLAAPLTAPVMAASHTTVVSDEMQGMADEMPCCPGQKDQKAKDCGSCPFIALCMLTITLPAPDGAAALVDRTFARRTFALPDDLLVDGLGEHPPDHPPRTSV
jgi:hypothetical protein